MSIDFGLVCVGGGPAGIAAAIEWKNLGGSLSEVLVLEKGGGPIDAIRTFYPDKKMTIANYKGLPTVTEGHLEVFNDLTKAETLSYFDALIEKNQIPMRYSSEVFKIQRAQDVLEVYVQREKIRAKAVLIGIGILGRPNKPDYKIPVSLRNTVLYDLTSQPIRSGNVLVVGGGDTSSEYCQVLATENCEITLAYRGATFHRMMPQNQKALEDLSARGRLKILQSCEIHEVLDEGGMARVTFADSQKFPVQKFDKVIYAIGGSTPVNFLKTAGVTFTDSGATYGSSGETAVKGLYLAGDLVCGKNGGSIITAYNSAFRAVKHIRNL